MSIERFNTRKRIDFEVKTEDWEIVKLTTLEEGKAYDLKGFIPTKEGKFGAGVLLISDGVLVGVPNRYREIALEMMRDDDIVEDIKDGKCAFKYTLHDNEKGNPAQVIEFITK